MKTTFWIAVSRKGSIRSTKNKPTLYDDEISIMLNLDLPDELFRQPKLVADITIPESAATPDLINSEVVDNVKEAIQVATGLDFKISVIEPETEVSKN